MPGPTVRRLPALSAIFVIVLSCLAGCGEPPRKEMDQAQGAIDAARAAGAAEYATAELDAAVAALARADEAAAQRDYRQALNQALDARERAQTAARDAANRKAEVRSVAERDAQALGSVLQAASSRVAALRERKTPPARLESALAAVAAAEQAMQEARAQLGAQQYTQAVETLRAPASRLQAAMADLDQAALAAPPTRPARRPR